MPSIAKPWFATPSETTCVLSTCSASVPSVAPTAVARLQSTDTATQLLGIAIGAVCVPLPESSRTTP